MTEHAHALLHPSSVERTVVLLVQAASDLFHQGYGAHRSPSREALLHTLDAISILAERNIGRLDKCVITDFVDFVHDQIG